MMKSKASSLQQANENFFHSAFLCSFVHVVELNIVNRPASTSKKHGCVDFIVYFHLDSKINCASIQVSYVTAAIKLHGLGKGN